MSTDLCIVTAAVGHGKEFFYFRLWKHDNLFDNLPVFESLSKSSFAHTTDCIRYFQKFDTAYWLKLNSLNKLL